MKQNIFGVFLFGFIVGTAIFVSELFVKLPSPSKVEEKPFVFESKNRCSKVVYQPPVSSLAKIKITQAVLNPQNGKLSTSLVVQRENQLSENLGLTFYFYVKNGDLVRYLGSHSVTVKKELGTENNEFHEVLSSFSGLKNLDSKSNLYLIAGQDSNIFRPSETIPRFDVNNATPVLLLKGL